MIYVRSTMSKNRRNSFPYWHLYGLLLGGVAAGNRLIKGKVGLVIYSCVAWLAGVADLGSIYSRSLGPPKVLSK
jgi:hypothetical protein